MGYCDYLLTVVGYRFYKKYYAAILDVEHYELNPFWQKSVERMRLFDWRHLLFLTALCFWLWRQYIQLVREPNIAGASDLLETSLGFIIFLYLIINLGHLTNIYTFWRIGRSRLKGQRGGGYAETVHLTVARTAKFVVILIVVWIFARDWFFFGAAMGPLMLVVSFGFLARKAARTADGQPIRKRDYFWILARLIVLLLVLSLGWEWWQSRRPYAVGFEKATTFQSDGELEKAVEQYIKVLEEKPDYYPAIFNLSIAYSQLGKNTESLTMAARALKLKPKEEQAHELFEEVLSEFIASQRD